MKYRGNLRLGLLFSEGFRSALVGWDNILCPSEPVNSSPVVYLLVPAILNTAILPYLCGDDVEQGIDFGSCPPLHGCLDLVSLLPRAVLDDQVSPPTYRSSPMTATSDEVR
jgi:hypothetical protein